MKTSRYSNQIQLAKPQYLPLGITLGNPRFQLRYKLAGNLRLLAPSGDIFHVNEQARFRKLFYAQMERTGVARIRAALDGYAQPGRELVLLCFEDVLGGDWCHRRIFADWWLMRTGEEVAELEPEPITLPELPEPEPNLFGF